MDLIDLQKRLSFIRAAEQLKNVLRSAHTSAGRHESTAEHTWRLCLLAMAFEDRLGGLDFARLLKICVIHDLGEAFGGDVPAVERQTVPDKPERERRDLLRLLAPLSPRQQGEFLALWEEYENAATPEALAVKALDKIETIIQHNQGVNPADFDYGFNLSYGQAYTSASPLFTAIRTLVDEETRRRDSGEAVVTAD